MKKENYREDYLDSLTGVFILFMVIHHWQSETQLLSQIYHILLPFFFFFMAFFFYKSGLVFNLHRDCIEVIKSSSKRLLIPFIIYSVIGYSVWGVQLLMENNLHLNYLYSWISELLMNGALFSNGPLWYLFSLFVIRVLFSFVSGSNYYLIILTIFGLLVAVEMHDIRLYIPIWCYNIPLGIFFFGMGTLKIEKYLNIWAVVLCSLVYISSVLLFPSSVSFFENKLCYGNYYIWIAASISGNLLFNFFLSKLPTIKLLCYIGRHSMTILVWHMPILSIHHIVQSLIK